MTQSKFRINANVQVQTFQGASPPKWDWITRPPKKVPFLQKDKFGVSTVSFDAPSWFGNPEFEAAAKKVRRRPKYLLDGDMWLMEPPESKRDYEAEPVQHSRPQFLDFTHNRLYGGKAAACNARQPQAMQQTQNWPVSARQKHHRSSDMSRLTSASYGASYVQQADSSSSYTGLLTHAQAPVETPRKPLKCPDAYAPIPRATTSNWRSTLPRLRAAEGERQYYAASLAERSLPRSSHVQRAKLDSTAACFSHKGHRETSDRPLTAASRLTARSWQSGSLTSRRTRTPGR